MIFGIINMFLWFFNRFSVFLHLLSVLSSTKNSIYFYYFLYDYIYYSISEVSGNNIISLLLYAPITPTLSQI